MFTGILSGLAICAGPIAVGVLLFLLFVCVTR
jgi:hypothetical protein